MIGFFDSGFGGLTVLKPVLERLKDYDYIYLGDNARAPYGGHGPEKIREFSEQAVNYLFENGAGIVIIACNTASANALRYLQQKYPQRKILGVLIPIAEESITLSGSKRIGVVGTRATIQSKSYELEIKKLDPTAQVFSRACPLLVPLIEEDWHKTPEARSILKKYLRPLKSHQVDTLILGCTHYPLMQKDFIKFMGRRVKVLETGEIVAQKLEDYLKSHTEIANKLSRGSKRKFLTTDSPEKFKKFVEKHCGMKIPPVEKVSI